MRKRRPVPGLSSSSRGYSHAQHCWAQESPQTLRSRFLFFLLWSTTTSTFMTRRCLPSSMVLLLVDYGYGKKASKSTSSTPAPLSSLSDRPKQGRPSPRFGHPHAVAIYAPSWNCNGCNPVGIQYVRPECVCPLADGGINIDPSDNEETTSTRSLRPPCILGGLAVRVQMHCRAWSGWSRRTGTR